MAFDSLFSSSPAQPTDLSSFNYSTQADKIKRQRAIAEQLMQSKQPQGQMVPGGPNGFYVAPSMMATLGPALQQMMGAYMSGKQDDAQTALDKNSIDATTQQLNSLGASVRDPKQDGIEADAQLARESRRAQSSGVDAGQTVGDAPAPDSGAQSSPVPPQTPDNGVPLAPISPSPVQTISPSVKAAVGSALSGSGGQFGGSGASGSWGAPDAPAPQAQGPMPPMPQGAPMPQLGPQPVAQSPAPVAQATTPQASAPAPMVQGEVSNPDPYSRAPNEQEKVSRLIALSRTGPEGQRIAQGQMDQMYASKNGRYTVHSDPINGGFVELDTATGHAVPLGTGSAQKVLESKDTPNGVMERTAQGWRMAQGPGGAPVVSNAVAADSRAANDQTVKMAAAVTSNQSAVSAIGSAQTRLARIDQLAKETETGPVAGHLPNWTAKRQELGALMAQDVFAETRDAVAGAADAGGAPRMAQSEFKYMANNGGLTQNMSYAAIHNLIAQQNIRLDSLKTSLTSHAKTLNGVAPAAQQSGAPARGQSVNASQYGF